MSVPKRQRKESNALYVTTAGEIYKAVLQYCIKLPKRYSSIVTHSFVDLANKAYACCISANSIYHTNKHEAQIRVDQIILAKNYLYSLQAQIEIFTEIIKTNKEEKPWMFKALNKIGVLINEEFRLLSNILPTYRKNYREAPNDNYNLVSEFGNITDDEMVLLKHTLYGYRNRYNEQELCPNLNKEKGQLEYFDNGFNKSSIEINIEKKKKYR